MDSDIPIKERVLSVSQLSDGRIRVKFVNLDGKTETRKVWPGEPIEPPTVKRKEDNHG